MHRILSLIILFLKCLLSDFVKMKNDYITQELYLKNIARMP